MSKESEQEKNLISESADYEHKLIQNKNKNYLLGIISLTIILVIVVPYSLYVATTGQQYFIPMSSSLESGYVIQNLKGDTIDTWLSWRLTPDETIQINLLDSEKYPERVEIMKKVILSMEAIDIDDSLLHKGPKDQTSTFFMGWKGALQKSSETPTRFYIPSNLKIIESNNGEGDITIKLTNTKNGDGYSGFTKTIADDSQNQILKSQITLYEIDSLSTEQFTAILRHELGHAFGLAHSSDPDDLMYPTITTNYPYISECDIDAITTLYDGKGKSQVICEK